MSAERSPVLMARDELIEEVERLRRETVTLHRLLAAVLHRSELVVASMERRSEEPLR